MPAYISKNNIELKQCSQIKYYEGVNKTVYEPGDEISFKRYLNSCGFQGLCCCILYSFK